MGLVDKGRMPAPLTKLLNMSRSYSLWVYQWGLACCAIEMGAAFASPRYDVMRLGVIPLPASPRQADFVCVSGTVTDKMAPAVRRLWEQMPEPKYAISMGSCANCGGPYWDSYSVTKGVDQIIPIDIYVPGCPPRPEALLEAVVLLQQRIKNEDMAAKWRGDEYRSTQRTKAIDDGGATTHGVADRADPRSCRRGSRSWWAVAPLSDQTRPRRPPTQPSPTKRSRSRATASARASSTTCGRGSATRSSTRTSRRTTTCGSASAPTRGVRPARR